MSDLKDKIVELESLSSEATPEEQSKIKQLMDSIIEALRMGNYGYYTMVPNESNNATKYSLYSKTVAKCILMLNERPVDKETDKKNLVAEMRIVNEAVANIFEVEDDKSEENRKAFVDVVNATIASNSGKNAYTFKSTKEMMEFISYYAISLISDIAFDTNFEKLDTRNLTIDNFR